MFRFEKSVYPVGLTYPMFHFPHSKIISTYFFAKKRTLEHSLYINDLPTTM